MLRKILIFSLLILMMSVPCHAEIQEIGTGMVFGDNHAFLVTAPERWVLDNQSGAPFGIYMLFYPAGRTWQDSMAFVYGQAVSKKRTI